MSVISLCMAAALGITLSMLAATGSDAEASGAIDKIHDLYAEFQTFKNGNCPALSLARTWRLRKACV